jgi:hypothetical protein
MHFIRKLAIVAAVSWSLADAPAFMPVTMLPTDDGIALAGVAGTCPRQAAPAMSSPSTQGTPLAAAIFVPCSGGTFDDCAAREAGAAWAC